MNVDDWTQIRDQIDIHFQTLVATESSPWLGIWHILTLYYFLLICSPSKPLFFFFPQEANRLAIRAQLRSLKGKFHRLSGAIDFHLSVHRAKVCVGVKQTQTDIISTKILYDFIKFAPLLFIAGFGQR